MPPDKSRLQSAPGPKRNLFAHVVENIGLRIIRGELSPSLPFPKEADLGMEFGASRSVIREAVKSLAARGLIASQTRTGIRVLEPINWNLLDAEVLNWRYSVMPREQFYGELFEIRRLIEPEAARLAALRGSEAEIAAIASAFAAMTDAAQTGRSGVAADLAFHRAILAAAHNALLLQMGNLIAVGLDIAHRLSSASFVVFLPMHKAVLDAIQARDGAGGEAAMRHLLSETREFMSRLIRA